MWPNAILLFSGYLCLPALFLFISGTAATTYHTSKIYQGQTFFDDWFFFNNRDILTQGNVFYVSSSDAAKDQLAFINNAGNAIMKVDNTSNLLVGQSRNSVRIQSKDIYEVGSLWVADMLHVPFGCATWPAWWSASIDWPAGGEIDTFEGVNAALRNTMSLHTTPGCMHTGSNGTQTSTIVNSTDCSYLSNGCGVTDPGLNSYGAAFAAAGGGVFVTEFAELAISVWFFTRSSIPPELQGNSSTIDTSILGIPTASWPTSGCNIDHFFKPQQLVFDITLCGEFAGQPDVFSQTCPGICYDDYVVGPGSQFDNAYFEVASIRVFNNGSDRTIVGGGSSAGTSHLFHTSTTPGRWFIAGLLMVSTAVGFSLL